MEPVSGKRLAKVLAGKGWTLDRVDGSHHVFVRPTIADPVSVPIRGNRDLKLKTQESIMKAAGLTDADP